MDSTSSINDAISLAYISDDNEEHYDACVPYYSAPEHTSHINECSQTSTVEESETAVSNTECIYVTPRKRAKYCSSKKKQSSCKRKRNPDKWQRNIRKRLLLSDEEYKGVSGKAMPAKHEQAIDCSRCRFNCSCI